MSEISARKVWSACNSIQRYVHSEATHFFILADLCLSVSAIMTHLPRILQHGAWLRPKKNRGWKISRPVSQQFSDDFGLTGLAGVAHEPNSGPPQSRRQNPEASTSNWNVLWRHNKKGCEMQEAMSESAIITSLYIRIKLWPSLSGLHVAVEWRFAEGGNGLRKP